MSVITASIPTVATIRQFPYRRPRGRTLAAAIVLAGVGLTLLHASDPAPWKPPLATLCFLAAGISIVGLIADAVARPVIGFEGNALVVPAGLLSHPRKIEPLDVLHVDSFQAGRHALIRLHTRAGRYSVSSTRLGDDGMTALYAWIDRHLSR